MAELFSRGDNQPPLQQKTMLAGVGGAALVAGKGAVVATAVAAAPAAVAVAGVAAVGAGAYWLGKKVFK